MKLHIFNPTTASLRSTKLVRIKNETLAGEEEAVDKARGGLLSTVRYAAGRNNKGRVTMRSKGGREKRNYRVVDFKRDKKNIPAKVMTLEYDPNRTALIAMVRYADGEYRYILAPNGLQLGQTIISSDKFTTMQPGNSHPLSAIPAASFVHNIELEVGQGGVMGRAAGTSIQIQGTSAGYVQLKMPSGEIRLVNGDCYATLGVVSNLEHQNESLGKAGRSRHMGIKPIVRGVAQSYKHPHGGGQGKSGRHGTGGPAKDLWGNKRGKITRRNKKTNKFIVSRRTSTLRPTNKPYKTIA